MSLPLRVWIVCCVSTTCISGRAVDFVEIGTSDFNTLIETAADSSVGLSVEMMAYHLEKLPSKPGVTKVNAAISDSEEATRVVFFIHPDDIAACVV